MKIRIEESWFVILGIPMDDFKIPTSKRKGEFLSPSSLFAFSTHLTWFWKHQIHWISTLFPQKATEPASVPRRHRAGKPHRWNICPNQKRKKPGVSDLFRDLIQPGKFGSHPRNRGVAVHRQYQQTAIYSLELPQTTQDSNHHQGFQSIISSSESLRH